jgi:hypothetical protein
MFGKKFVIQFYKFIIEKKTTNVITLGQAKYDNNRGIITITEDTVKEIAYNNAQQSLEN